ncbi:MAG: hypothetical protein KAR19_11720, partial [Bacteroidales bacterium]|nr:hypothetical protein [Bacteroidales bacterium]
SIAQVGLMIFLVVTKSSDLTVFLCPICPHAGKQAISVLFGISVRTRIGYGQKYTIFHRYAQPGL